LRDVGVDRIILKLIHGKRGARMWGGFIWFRPNQWQVLVKTAMKFRVP